MGAPPSGRPDAHWPQTRCSHAEHMQPLQSAAPPPPGMRKHHHITVRDPHLNHSGHEEKGEAALLLPAKLPEAVQVALSAAGPGLNGSKIDAIALLPVPGLQHHRPALCHQLSLHQHKNTCGCSQTAWRSSNTETEPAEMLADWYAQRHNHLRHGTSSNTY